MTDEVYEYQQSMQEQAKAAHRTPISPTRTASEAENHKKDGPCQTLVLPNLPSVAGRVKYAMGTMNLSQFSQRTGISGSYLCWSNEQSYEWCFDGEPQHSIVAISSVGTQQSKQNQALFEKGVRAALARLEPSEILWQGKCPEEFDWNVTKIQPYYKQVKRRCKNGR